MEISIILTICNAALVVIHHKQKNHKWALATAVSLGISIGMILNYL